MAHAASPPSLFPRLGPLLDPWSFNSAPLPRSCCLVPNLCGLHSTTQLFKLPCAACRCLQHCRCCISAAEVQRAAGRGRTPQPLLIMTAITEQATHCSTLKQAQVNQQAKFSWADACDKSLKLRHSTPILCFFPCRTAPVAFLFCLHVTYVRGLLALTKIWYVGSWRC